MPAAGELADLILDVLDSHAEEEGKHKELVIRSALYLAQRRYSKAATDTEK
jgi:hypothetical protein